MRYHNITKDDMLNGDGLRVVLWVAGCEHHCPNSMLKNFSGTFEKNYVSGITFSGGDPLHTQNRKDVGALIEEIKEKFPNKTIWIYSGYDWQDVKDLPCMKYVDVMVDGEFVDGLKDNKLL